MAAAQSLARPARSLTIARSNFRASSPLSPIVTGLFLGLPARCMHRQAQTLISIINESINESQREHDKKMLTLSSNYLSILFASLFLTFENLVIYVLYENETDARPAKTMKS